MMGRRLGSEASASDQSRPHPPLRPAEHSSSVLRWAYLNRISGHKDIFASDTVTIDCRPVAVSEIAAGLHDNSNPR